ncbi:hypothetical protein BDP27DRAFT_1420995 [Rhodocollybia butyracea]|uniref:TPR-like protein n=1 Tax=Rhodocollybia butyracea TaxID=206335 RepID=A0A9P5U813_9AGAR|nr:hypothetical protein BDP27DRAFT_1420995 [Rhodocollybia butyracea]
MSTEPSATPSGNVLQFYQSSTVLNVNGGTVDGGDQATVIGSSLNVLDPSGPQMFSQASNFQISNSIFQSAHTINNNIINNSLENISAPLGYQQRMSNVPSSTQQFIGRDTIISSLESHFLEGTPSVAQRKQKIYLLWGLGGAGKTQTALEFAFRFQDSFSKVFLICAASENLIHASFYDIAKQEGLVEPTWLIGKGLLEDRKEEWLTQHGKILPSCRHGNIIITSRNEALVQLTVGDGMATELKGMDEEDAIKLLSIYAGVKNATAEESATLVDITRTLHGFPLALIQAGAYIQQLGCLSTYLERFQSQRAEILATDRSQSIDDYTLSIYSTWNLSWKMLSDSAQEFLRICSYLHFENIPRRFFQRAVQNVDTISQKHPGELMNQVIATLQKLFLNPRQWNDLAMDSIIIQLKSFSLIQVLHGGILYNIHPLVHQWVLDGIKNHMDTLVTAVLATSFGNLRKNETSKSDTLFVLEIQSHSQWAKPLDINEVFIWEAFRQLWSRSGHFAKELELAKHMLHVSETSNGKEHPETLKCTENLGVVYSRLGQYNNALELEQPLLERSKDVLGEQHSDTLMRIQYLATTYQDIGKYNDALRLQEPLLELSKTLLGGQYPETLRRTQDLAITYGRLGRYDEALDLRKSLLQLFEEIWGKEHPETLSQVQNLAVAYKMLGDHNKALELEKPLVELSEKLLGNKHPTSLNRLQNLGRTYQELGRYNNALELQEPLLSLSEKVLGKRHPYTLIRIDLLGVTYGKLGRYKDALELQETLPTLSEQVLGDQHPDTLNRIQNLAITYHDLDRYKEALDLEEPLAKLSAQLLGPQHPDTLTRNQNLAIAYKGLGQYNQALGIEEPLFQLSQQFLGSQHVDTLARMGNLAVTYKMLGNFSKALQLEEPLLKLSEEVLGKYHPQTLTHTHNLAITFGVFGRHNEALELEKPLLEISKEKLGAQNPVTLARAQHLAVTLKALYRYKEALELEQPLLELSSETLGGNHQLTLLRNQNLAITFRHLGRHKEALELEESLVSVTKQLQGERHPNTLVRMESLAKTYSELGEYHKALELEEPLVTLSSEILGKDHLITLRRRGP